MKKLLQILCVLLMLLFIGRASIFRYYIKYIPTGEREMVVLNDQKMIDKLRKEKGDKELSIEQIIDLSQKLTTSQLRFTSGKASSNPNNILKSRKANCIGYAALFSAITDFLIKDANLSTEYKVSHLVGTLDYMGENLNEKFNHPFFKDHDFNAIEVLQTGEKIYVDPSVSDYLGIDRVEVLK